MCQHEFRDGSESLRNPKLSAASALHTHTHTRTHKACTASTSAPIHCYLRQKNKLGWKAMMDWLALDWAESEGSDARDRLGLESVNSVVTFIAPM